jgi:hypothetical protein
MPFTQFVATRTRGRRENNDFALVTMRNNGMVHLNTRAYQLLGNPAYVTFLHDEENGRFAIQAVDTKIAGQYILAVRQMSNIQHGYDVSAQTFMQETGFANGNLRKWAADFDGDLHALICGPDNEQFRKAKKSANGRSDLKAQADELVSATS